MVWSSGGLVRSPIGDFQEFCDAFTPYFRKMFFNDHMTDFMMDVERGRVSVSAREWLGVISRAREIARKEMSVDVPDRLLWGEFSKMILNRIGSFHEYLPSEARVFSGKCDLVEKDAFACDPLNEAYLSMGERLKEWEPFPIILRKGDLIFRDAPMSFESLVIPSVGVMRGEAILPRFLNGHFSGGEVFLRPEDYLANRKAVMEAKGKILVIGFRKLGHYAFLAAKKKEVEKVFIVEGDPDLYLLAKSMLENFPESSKISLVRGSDDFDEKFFEVVKDGFFDIVRIEKWSNPWEAGDYAQLKWHSKTYKKTRVEFHREGDILAHRLSAIRDVLIRRSSSGILSYLHKNRMDGATRQELADYLDEELLPWATDSQEIYLGHLLQNEICESADDVESKLDLNYLLDVFEESAYFEENFPLDVSMEPERLKESVRWSKQDGKTKESEVMVKGHGIPLAREEAMEPAVGSMEESAIPETFQQVDDSPDALNVDPGSHCSAAMDLDSNPSENPIVPNSDASSMMEDKLQKAHEPKAAATSKTTAIFDVEASPTADKQNAAKNSNSASKLKPAATSNGEKATSAKQAKKTSQPKKTDANPFDFIFSKVIKKQIISCSERSSSYFNEVRPFIRGMNFSSCYFALAGDNIGHFPFIEGNEKFDVAKVINPSIGYDELALLMRESIEYVVENKSSVLPSSKFVEMWNKIFKNTINRSILSSICACKIGILKAEECFDSELANFYKHVEVDNENYKFLKPQEDSFEMLSFNLRMSGKKRLICDCGMVLGNGGRSVLLHKKAQEYFKLSAKDAMAAKDVSDSLRGSILFLGAGGLCYLPFLASKKQDVVKITIVDSSPVMDFVEEILLPRLGGNGRKIEIVKEDPYDHLSRAVDGEHDFCVVRMWDTACHPASGQYLRYKMLSNGFKKTRFMFWLEDEVIACLMPYVFFLLNRLANETKVNGDSSSKKIYRLKKDEIEFLRQLDEFIMRVLSTKGLQCTD